MKTFAFVSLPAVLAALTLSPMSQALAGPKSVPGVGRTIARPDLRCSIKAFEDVDGMKPIADGATLSYGGGGQQVYVRLIVENNGQSAAAGFNSNLRVKRNGANVFSESETLTLSTGLAKIYPLVPVAVTGAVNKVHASISLDGRNAVLETSEHNNACSFDVTVHVVQ